jgi:hypothetical protein
LAVPEKTFTKSIQFGCGRFKKGNPPNVADESFLNRNKPTAARKPKVRFDDRFFKPEEMHDLSFEPAIPILAGKLGSAYGCLAAANLAPICAEALPLLQNSEPLGRMIGLQVLYENANQQSVELALPLLNDPVPGVRQEAAATLRALTDEPFTAEQFTEWNAWWARNKTHFVVLLHPEELPPRFHHRLANGPHISSPTQ